MFEVNKLFMINPNETIFGVIKSRPSLPGNLRKLVFRGPAKPLQCLMLANMLVEID